MCLEYSFLFGRTSRKALSQNFFRMEGVLIFFVMSRIFIRFATYANVCFAFITSREVHRDDVLCIRVEDKDFSMTGLKVTSSVCVGKIATLHKRLIVGEIGKLSDAWLRELDLMLRKIFKI